MSDKPYLTLEYFSFAATFHERSACLSNNIWHLHGVLHILAAHIKTNSGSIKFFYIGIYTADKTHEAVACMSNATKLSKKYNKLCLDFVALQNVKTQKFQSRIKHFQKY